MNKLTDIYYKVRDLTKITYSVVSICFVIGVLFLAIYWLLSSEYYYQVRPFRDKPVQISTTGGVFDTSIIIIGSGRAQFSRWIEDQNGNIMYEYQPYKVNSSMESNIKQSLVRVPPLPVGRYHMHGKLYYQVNPLKTSEVDIDLGGFDVK